MAAKIHIGTMGWSYDFWTSNFYPKDAKPDSFLSEYAKHFHTVEVDNTFYRIPSKDTVVKWRDQTPPEFLFSAKFPRRITHEKMLKDCDEIVRVFFERMSLLQVKHGPLLLQFPYAFKLEHLDLLRDFLSTLPKTLQLVVEVRNKKLLTEELYSLLQENRTALALVEQPFMPTTEVMTSNFAYIRLEGDRRKVSGTLGKVEIDRTEDVSRWAEKIKKWADLSSDVFVYFSKFYSGHPPTDAKQLASLLQVP
jgi:uncharacterized protein YecE (DUF72 family)